MFVVTVFVASRRIFSLPRFSQVQAIMSLVNFSRLIVATRSSTERSPFRKRREKKKRGEWLASDNTYSWGRHTDTGVWNGSANTLAVVM